MKKPYRSYLIAYYNLKINAVFHWLIPILNIVPFFLINWIYYEQNGDTYSIYPIGYFRNSEYKAIIYFENNCTP